MVSKHLPPTLRGRTKPQLGQDEVPGLEADQCAGIPSGPEAFPQNGPQKHYGPVIAPHSVGNCLASTGVDALPVLVSRNVLATRSPPKLMKLNRTIVASIRNR